MMPSADGPGIVSSTQGNACDVQDWIKSELKDIVPNVKVYIKPLYLPDPTDIPDILKVSKEAVEQCINAVGSDAECFVNMSSGTPQMKLAQYMLSYGNVYRNYRIMQVNDPEKVSPEKRIIERSIGFLDEENVVKRAIGFINKGLFNQASEEMVKLSQISIYSNKKVAAEIISKVLEGYHYWDLIQYKRAYEIIYPLWLKFRDAVDMKPLMEVLGSQVDYLAELQKENKYESPHNMVDLYYNARRRLSRDDYTDTVARFWRIYEGSLQYYILKKYRVDTHNINDSNDGENKRKALLWTNGKPTMSWIACKYFLTDTLHDTNYAGFLNTIVTLPQGTGDRKIKIDRVMEDIRAFRNDSIVAHGMKPVEERYARWSVLVSENILKALFGKDIEPLIYDYPLNDDRINSIVEIIKGI
jgi:CRISPR-associated protein (Cas_Cas02710).